MYAGKDASRRTTALRRWIRGCPAPIAPEPGSAETAAGDLLVSGAPERHASRVVLRAARSFVFFCVASTVVSVAGPTALVGCRKSSAGGSESSDKAGPPEVTDASENLLFTWIDEKGEFHVEQKVASVPASARDLVRVVDPEKGAPPELVYLVDLRTAGPNGTYPVRTAPRDAFEKVAVERRAKSGKVLAAAPPSSAAPAGSGEAADLVDRPDVIIYGAEWCGPCHQAEAYMKKRGIPYVEKDIEKDSGAQREMRAKLAKAGMRGGSIPVIDVKGKLMLGFDANAVERALKL